MHFSIRHRRKNQVPRIDGAQMVARQCGDFWTIVYPAPVRFVEINSCKFRGLDRQPGIAGRWQPQRGGSAFPWRGLGPAGSRRACATGCFSWSPVSLHFATRHSRRLDSLSANAYDLYLVRYIFVMWPQYALLGTARRQTAVVASTGKIAKRPRNKV
jgi:hypothetical protein